ncbi:hypothetical protein LTR08_001430 [Meristemomyces frigidus]|nr:hypothetical protein LTR08_001430 [Meristemomyces frigidus]
MASQKARIPAKQLFTGFRPSQHPAQRCTFTRGMATEAPVPTTTLSEAAALASALPVPPQPTHISTRSAITPPPALAAPPAVQRPQNPFLTTATCTLHAFPSLTPAALTTYPGTHLLLPLRKDLLHRAVVYEGDRTRQGTASTLWRDEVHGSNRKIRPQKGTGSARLGDKKSPMLKGGGVAFGPKPRDFSTKLPRKVYDVAWRTALSYRYAKGQLVVLEDEAELSGVHPHSAQRYLLDLLRYNKMGHADGRTLFVTLERREGLYAALEAEGMGRDARALNVLDVDVKDLLELGRVVVEKRALDFLLQEHEDDLGPAMRLGAWGKLMAGQSASASAELRA